MSKRDELAAVLGEHGGFEACSSGWRCHCRMTTLDPDAHLVDAVLAWLDGQFGEGLRGDVMLGIAGTQKPCRKAIRDNGGCVTDFGPCLCASETDAALAAVRERLGLSDAAHDAQDWAVGPGSVRMGTGEDAGELGRNGSIQEGEA